MHVSFVYAPIFCVDDRGITTEILCFRASSEALATSLAYQASLHAETQAVLALILLEALGTTSGGNHLG